MSNKDIILDLLKNNELTVKEIAEKITLSENETRVYIHRLKEDNLIKEKGKKDRYFIYTAIKKETNSNCNDDILFLYRFFRRFQDTITKDDEIVDYIIKHEDKFNKYEEMHKNA